MPIRQFEDVPVVQWRAWPLPPRRAPERRHSPWPSENDDLRRRPDDTRHDRADYQQATALAIGRKR